MDKMIYVLIGVLCIGVIALLMVFFRKRKVSPINENPTGGIKDNTNYAAPKEIRSDELISFKTEFYRNSDFVYDKAREYNLKMIKSEGDTFIITEGYDEKLKCETDREFSAKLQHIIREHNLARYNGIERLRSGLPEEYGPCRVNAKYASKEEINFLMDGDPNSPWTGEVLDLFAKEFGKHGINDLLPTKEESAMTRFSMEYAFGDNRYCYSEVWIPVTEEEKARSFEEIMTGGRNYDDCVKKAYAEVWDRKDKKKTENDRYAATTKEHYLALQKIVEETELNRFQNGNIFPNQFDYDNTPQFYEFYVEYESGKQMSGFSDDPEQCEKFKPVATTFSRYYDQYLENNKE
ncbi:MAG: hypothetical protein MJ124_06735 [Lachnospiraceae bacterium]|nr:hypothetical protein [Lachnospiraceae bacterium]